MMRRNLLLLSLLLTMPLLLAAAPAQQLGEFEFQWWHGVILVTCVLLPIFLFIIALAFRQAPDEEALREAARQEEADRAEARAAARQQAADASAAPEPDVVTAEGEPEPVSGPPVAPDDLTKIEGIGPKTAEVLEKAGIKTFSELAKVEVVRLREILAAAGRQFALSDPATWPEQAALAAAGKWEALAALQDELDGGRRDDSQEG